MTSQKFIPIHRKILLVLACIVITAGCAGFERQSKPAVPEIHPGILAGYLQLETLPNSLALIPPPPAEGSAAFALDEEVNRKNLALQGTPRWKLAAEDAELMFPEAAGTFSCALLPLHGCVPIPHSWPKWRLPRLHLRQFAPKASNLHATARPTIHRPSMGRQKSCNPGMATIQWTNSICCRRSSANRRSVS